MTTPPGPGDDGGAAPTIVVQALRDGPPAATPPPVPPPPPAAGPPPPPIPVRPAPMVSPNGREPWRPPGLPVARSSYLDHLPGIYQEDGFLARFLLIFESVLGPIERTVDNIPWYFDPRIAPPDFVPWLGSWLGLVMDERWPEDRRRELVASAAALYQWCGTPRGMREFLRIYTGIEPEVIEPSYAEVTNARELAYRFAVRLRVPRGRTIDRDLVDAIIQAEKPAFASYILEIVEARGR